MNRDNPDFLSNYIKRVNEFVESTLHGYPESLYDASFYYLRSGGKRIRPFMALKSCEMFGGSSEIAMPAAVAVELIHNFSLVHDDIMDNDDTRHSVTTVHKKYGTPFAILAGDVLFSKAFQLLAINCNRNGVSPISITDMVARLSTACIYVCEGQALDVTMASDSKIPSHSDYLDMIGKKTAALFDVSCAVGTLASNTATNDNVEDLSSFGKNVGVAFQLIDDLIGITGDAKITGKSVGNDIREGKKTIPIILALNNSNTDQKERILKVFGMKNASQSDIESAVTAIREPRIEKEVRDMARLHMDKALILLDEYPSSEAKTSLEYIAHFIVERSL